MLTVIVSRNAGDSVKHLRTPAILATSVINYNFQKCWRRMLTIRMFGNAGDNYILISGVYHKKYNYNSWRAPHKL